MTYTIIIAKIRKFCIKYFGNHQLHLLHVKYYSSNFVMIKIDINLIKKSVFSIPGYLRIAVFLFFLGLIAFGSLTPPKSFPKLLSIPHFDKVVHFLMYFIFCILGIWAKDKRVWQNSIYKGTTPVLRDYIFILFIAIVWGLLMEVAQYLMGFGRSYSSLDLLANTTGAISGTVLYFIQFKGVGQDRA